MADMIKAWIRGEDVFDQKGQKVTRFFFKDNGVLQYEKLKGTIHPNSVITNISTKTGTSVVDTLLSTGVFSFPKPVELIKYFMPMVKDGDIVLDFFSGSGTSAHAVMQLNAEGENEHRKFIMVQWPEQTPPDSEAAKAGYKNICEIGKERIRRAGAKIKDDLQSKAKSLESTIDKMLHATPDNTVRMLLKEQQKEIAEKIYKEQIVPKQKELDAINRTIENLDIGFRVFKCEDSNYKEVAFAPKEYSQEMLLDLLNNIKEDRTDFDLLFDCMLRWGVELSLPLSSQKVDGCTIHNVNDGDLGACFDGNVTEKVIDAIAALSPVRVVFRDSSFNEAAQKMNLFELFKQKCDWTDEEVRNNVRVI
jgi:adenine-specific DNA-methyltransferase